MSQLVPNRLLFSQHAARVGCIAQIDIEIVGGKPHPRLSPLPRGAEWDVYEAMFYSINVGLGVGYGQFQVVGSNGKMFTVAYCIMGARPAHGQQTRALALAAAHS